MAAITDVAWAEGMLGTYMTWAEILPLFVLLLLLLFSCYEVAA